MPGVKVSEIYWRTFCTEHRFKSHHLFSHCRISKVNAVWTQAKERQLPNIKTGAALHLLLYPNKLHDDTNLMHKAKREIYRTAGTIRSEIKVNTARRRRCTPLRRIFMCAAPSRIGGSLSLVLRAARIYAMNKKRFGHSLGVLFYIYVIWGCVALRMEQTLSRSKVYQKGKNALSARPGCIYTDHQGGLAAWLVKGHYRKRHNKRAVPSAKTCWIGTAINNVREHRDKSHSLSAAAYIDSICATSQIILFHLNSLSFMAINE